MVDTIHLSFSIGPVQGFLGQARRTRDLWAGSWLLSYLAESALVAAEKAGGKAMIPFRPEPEVVTSKKTAIGGIPNRFELQFDGADAEHNAMAAADAAKQGFYTAWRRVAAAVFDGFVAPVLNAGNGTPEIWQRQVENFWELAWVIGSPDPLAGNLGPMTAMRKNFRNVPATIEPGTKCSLMPQLQEISGLYGRNQWDAQREFWRQMIQKPDVGAFDLKDSERLCAIALVKRLFPKVMSEAIGDGLSRELHQVKWPSTAFIAALPWLRNLHPEARQVADDYQRLAESAGYGRSEASAARDAGIDWAESDGPIWFASAIRNDEPGREKLGTNPMHEDKTVRAGQVRDLLNMQKHLYQAAAKREETEELSTPIPYYALLLMDGDSLGRLSAQMDDSQMLSKSLDFFAKQVRGKVEQHFGHTVYAGGDDVLVLLPATTALHAANDLCDVYRSTFQSTPVGERATISAAIVFAQWRFPLRQVLRTAHRLLDDVAKEGTGRDSIAMGIVTGGGLSAVWSVPWCVLRGTAETAANDACVALDDILDQFSDDLARDETENPLFNASYLYLLHRLFNRLARDLFDKPGAFGQVNVGGELTPDLLRDLAHAEYRRRMKKSIRNSLTPEQTEPLIDQLMSVSRRWKRVERSDGGVEKFADVRIQCDRQSFSFDGWRVARFLKQVKDGKVSDHD